jgi:hypothetical protein
MVLLHDPSGRDDAVVDLSISIFFVVAARCRYDLFSDLLSQTIIDLHIQLCRTRLPYKDRY